jgi:uncharacterized membrane protein YfcA
MDWIILIAAAFGAGVLNTIAGGGSFLTFPALVFVGLPPVIANATSAVAVLPGYLSGALGFSRELREFDRPLLIRLTLWTFVGGLIGALLLLVSSDKAFSGIVPFLLLGATLIFLFAGRIRAFAETRARSVTPFGAVGLIAVSIYGGYFNGGLGIVLLALFALWGMQDLNQMNGLKNGLSFALSAISVLAFALGGLVAWPEAIVMMIAATIGGYAGAPIARALPKQVVVMIVVAVGFTMSAIFLGRLF